ncbi:MAG: hypothetical protein P8100_03240 [bacterium]|jgi:hypothetical protein
MKKLVILMMLPLFLTSCSGQISGHSGQDDSTTVLKKEKELPKADIRVNKTFDEDGNLLTYDSTYVWSYSNMYGDSVDVNIDSVMSAFWPFMDSRMTTLSPFLEDRWWGSDSLFYNEFLNQDYFMNRWDQQMEEMRRMMREMDSVKGLFFRENYPELNKDPNRVN